MKVKLKLLMVLVILLGIIPMNIMAKGNNSNEIIKDTYQFSAIEGGNKQRQNTFLYKDSDFTVSSFKGSKSLEVLSIQVAASSISYYGENPDKYGIDYSRNDYNVKDFLDKMKFSNIESNKYYNSEKKENSVGVIVGEKKIIQDGKEYTLLAIVPRSTGYKQEWVGNLEVGDGDLHEGFKSARDEILRFTKEYINKNNIKGNLKVWTVGYSRGAAISNLVGGFFAGGGIEYFGNDVKIKPEDVYCYTMATPSSIKNNTSKNVELSVSANRNTDDYVNDTVSNAFNYTKGGKVNLSDSIYNGIRSVISPDDIVAALPPVEWGFARYGTVVNSYEGLYSADVMLNELGSISDYVYGAYSNSKINGFSEKTFDLKTLSIMDKGSNLSQTEFLKTRLNGLLSKANTNKIYNDKYQDGVKATIGTIGMMESFLTELSVSDSSMELDDMIYPLVYSYLSYASSELQEKGVAQNESQAITIAIGQLLAYYSGEEIDYSTFTIDDCVKLVMKYLADNENQPVSNAVISAIVKLVPADYQPYLSGFKSFSKSSDASVEQGLKDFIRACYYGVDPESTAYLTYQSAEQARQMLYMLILFGLGNDAEQLQPLMISQTGTLDAHGKFEDFVEILLKMVKIEKDENGTVVKAYSSLEELADAKLISLFDKVLPDIVNNSQALYGEEFKNDLVKQINSMKQNISSTREILCSLLFYTDGGFNTVKSLENALTFVDNAVLFAVPHFDELYLALARTSNRYDDDYICIEGNGQSFENGVTNDLTLVFDIDYYLFVERGKLYIDGVEVTRDNYEIAKGSTIITIKADYLNTLGEGRHDVQAKVDDKSADAYFSVGSTGTDANNDEIDSNINNTENSNVTNTVKAPNTGDAITKYFVLFIGSISLFIVSIFLRKKHITK